MKKHTQIEELLAVYRDLDDEERRRVDRHVRVCAACTDRLAAYQAMDRGLAGLVDPQPDGQLREVFYSPSPLWGDSRPTRGAWGAVGVHSRQSQRFGGLRRPLLQVPALAGQVVVVGMLLCLHLLWELKERKEG